MSGKRNVRGILQGVAAFAVGAAAGSITALLLAPASGTVTRKRIGQRVRRLQQDATRRIDRTKRQLIRKAEGLREATTERLADARVWMNRQLANGHSNGHSHARKATRRVVRHA